MNRPSSFEDRLAAWLEEGPTSGPDDALVDALARTRSTRQRPPWLERLIGDAMETTWRAPDVRMARRLAFALLILMLALALTAGTLIVSAQLIRIMRPDDGHGVLPAVALPPTACPPGTVLHSGDIATIAGTGAADSRGDDGPATSAALATPTGIAVDPSGAIYVTDLNATVRRIGIDGQVTAYAGTGWGTPFESPTSLAVDTVGNLYVLDTSANTLFRVDPSGVITRIAGTGSHSTPAAGGVEPGDEGPAVDAELWAANVSVGPAGDLYIDGWGRYRRIDPEGIMHAFAGTGTNGLMGDHGQALSATFGGGPNAPAADPFGNVFLNDPGNFRIRKVDPSGVITTVAGNGNGVPSGDGGLAVEAAIGQPTTIAVDTAGNLYFTTGTSVRMVDTTGFIHTIAGTGTLGRAGDCGPAIEATLDFPAGVAVHDGIVYIADSSNNRVRMIVP